MTSNTHSMNTVVSGTELKVDLRETWSSLDLTGMDLKKRSELHWERKLWHIVTVSVMAAFYAYAPPLWSYLVLGLAAAVFIPFDLLRLRNPALNDSVVHLLRPIMRDSEFKKLAGTTYLIAGVGIVLLLFPREVVLLTVLFLAFADPIASFFGIKYGKDKIFGHKSLQGALAAFLVCTLISYFYLYSHNFLTERIFVVSLIAGLIGALAELIPVGKLDDNLTLPILAASGLTALFYLFGGVYVSIKPVVAGDSAPEVKKKLSMRIYILPNLMTTGNLFCGYYAILHSIQGEFVQAAYWICGASVFDFLDGRLARLTRATSKFGAEYDSLSDLVSFCVAPALLLYLWALQPFGRIGWLGSFLFVTCGALRLARFNVQANVIEKNFFQGLPTPMAAGIVASSTLAFQDMEWDAKGNIGLLVMTFLLAFVMVSTFKYRSFKDLDLKERLPFRYLVIGVAILIVVLYRPEVNLFFLFAGYAVLGAVMGILGFGKNKRIRNNVYLPAKEVGDQDLVEDDEGEPAED